MTVGQKGAPIIRTLALLMRSPGSLPGSQTTEVQSYSG